MVETPVVETPVVETPVVEMPVVETPVVETPVVETPIDEQKKPEEEPPRPFINDMMGSFAINNVIGETDMPDINDFIESGDTPLGEPDDFQSIKEQPPKKEPKPPEESMEDVPIITYDYDGDSYFLDNRGSLQRTFDFPDGSYPTHLCIYTCVRNGCCPYLLYLTVYDNNKNTLVFPTAETVDVGPEQSVDDIRERTMESFKNTLFDIFPPNDTEIPEDEDENESTDIYNPDLFQGLFLDEDHIFMVYDSTRVSVPLATNKEYFWLTPYEITVLYKYRNVDIDPSVTDFFHTVATASGFIDKSFHHLKRLSDGTLVPSPYVVFPCSPGSPGIFSVFGSSTSYTNPVQLPEEEVNLLIPTIEHPYIGNVPLFSSKPLDPSIPHIQRYVIFVDINGLEPFFVEKESPELIQHLYDLYQKRQYSSINFIEKDVEYWCVKSPLYMSQIHDRQLQTIPINTFKEIAASLVPKSAAFPKDVDTLSNDGSDAASDEGDELSDEGSEGSNEGSMRASDEDTDNEDLDDFHRGYEEGFLVGMKQKAVTSVA